MSLFFKNIGEQLSLLQRLNNVDSKINKAIDVCVETINLNGKIFLCGNGGSAADCQHIAAELTGRFIKDRKPISAIALTTDTSALTAISNDFGYDYIFSRQLEALAKAGDTLISISTSGNSRNLVNASCYAKDNGINIIGLLGRDGGLLKDLCDITIIVPSDSTPRIQETHILIGHTLCEGIEINLGLV